MGLAVCLDLFYSQLMLKIFRNNYQKQTLKRERSGSMVDCLSRDPGVLGLSLTGITALCPWARQINPSLVLIQPRKNWKIADWDVQNQNKQNKHYLKSTQ